MKKLVVSYLAFTVIVLGAFLYAQKPLLALAWLAFVGLNAVVLRQRATAPTYFEKLLLDQLKDSPQGLPQDVLRERFRQETPNLKSQEAEAVFTSALSRLENRQLVRMFLDDGRTIVERTPKRAPGFPPGTARGRQTSRLKE